MMFQSKVSAAIFHRLHERPRIFEHSIHSSPKVQPLRDAFSGLRASLNFLVAFAWDWAFFYVKTSMALDGSFFKPIGFKRTLRRYRVLFIDCVNLFTLWETAELGFLKLKSGDAQPEVH